MPKRNISAVLFAFLFAASHPAFAQAIHDRIANDIERTSSAIVKGHVHPLARREYDQGKVGDLFTMERITMMLKPSDSQQVALDAFLRQQQDPSSQNYHRWLTPEEFADRFGLTVNDYSRTVAWLQNQGLTIDETARGRNWVTFTGSARQVETAFGVEIHEYAVNGTPHYATATEPSVPRALSDIVLGFRSLDNFRPKHRMVSKPKFTSSTTGNHFLTADDFATIYDLKRLYSNGIDGTGQTIAVMGQTDIQLADIETFRSLSGLPASNPTVILVPGSRDPGFVSSEIGEADLDIQWSGAVARGATIIYVNSNNGAFDSLQYAVGQILAPVISISYGDCEANWSSSEMAALAAITQQGNAEGITIAAAAGDGGPADCDSDFSGRLTARLGMFVDAPASLPYVTGVGGTTLSETGSAWSSADQTFGDFFRKKLPNVWAGANNSDNGSALSYIPETAWNDTLMDGVLASTGGGRSVLFPKPEWQQANGVPNDNARDVPDIAFAASADHDGYLSCSQGSCANGFRATDGSLLVVGGTSVGAPVFAGIVALMNQATSSRQGNVNPVLYALSIRASAAFHDVNQGGNAVPCSVGSPGCSGDGSMGFAAASGYDLTTGLGSLDISAFVTAWQSYRLTLPVLSPLSPATETQRLP